ncbi:3-oxoacyl-(acyl-carrier protein) reductase-like protein [Coleophoma crateriformis]|uniref:3-oxoacyl-(Acyl-carrier protein) reductase-like protein n=1 Tax=Coleophoma crateriformis TaxID=565419 RepID=A0A3D8QUG9_9HELO|nr:3-oxoacyl-(acyl-carrier protein) reductase-like protein [Coleophoma crateriformis]
MAQNDIKGKLALVTGASGGIGSACARSLAAGGAHLALTYSTSLSSLETLVSSLKSDYPTIHISTHQVDLASPQLITDLYTSIATAHAGATVDILISNAGYGKRIVNVWEIPVEEFDYTLDVNLRASFLLVKGCVEGMKEKKWGRIVFVSSIAAYGAGLNGCHYAASKGGLTAMMKNLSSHLAQFNISVNDIAPAMIGATGMIPNADTVPGLVDSIPLHRLGEPEECANAVMMFVKTGYITGQSLLLAGGLMHK